MTDVTQEDRLKADETCVALLPTMPFDTDLGAFRESLAASFAAHRIAAERKGMMEAVEIARMRELCRRSHNVLAVIRDNRDPLEPIADNGMAVWDGLQQEAGSILPQLESLFRAALGEQP